jgi:hypothetical protein
MFAAGSTAACAREVEGANVAVTRIAANAVANNEMFDGDRRRLENVKLILGSCERG